MYKMRMDETIISFSYDFTDKTLLPGNWRGRKYLFGPSPYILMSSETKSFSKVFTVISYIQSV